MLVNDSIYLLDESLKKVMELKELEARLSDPVLSAQLNPQVGARCPRKRIYRLFFAS